MSRRAAAAALSAALLLATACEKSDTSALEARLAEAEDRIEHLEARLLAMAPSESGMEGASLEELAARLDSPDLVARYRAGRELVERGSDAWGEMQSLLSVGTERQREAAAMVLASSIDEGFVVETVALHQKEEDPKVRAWLDVALGRTDHDAAVEPLIADLQFPSRRVRAAAVRSLGQLGRPRAAVPLLHVALSGELGIGPMAHDAIFRLRPGAVLFLEGEWPSLDPRQRRSVLEIVGALPDDQVVAFLRQQLRDPEALVALTAAFELALRGDGSGGTLALARVGSDDPVVARVAREVLDALGERP